MNLRRCAAPRQARAGGRTSRAARALWPIGGRGHEHDAALSGLPDLAVTSLSIQTPQIADYEEFLETGAGFIAHTDGVLVSPWIAGAAEFRDEFLDAG